MRTALLAVMLLLTPFFAAAALGFGGSVFPPPEERATPAHPSPSPENAVDLETLYQQALHKEEGNGDLAAAADLYKRVVAEDEKSHALAAKAQLHLARILERQGKKDDAVAAYRLLVDRFPASDEAAAARDRLKALGAAQGAPAERDEDLRIKLQKRISLDMTEVPLDSLVGFLRAASEVNMVVDATSIPWEMRPLDDRPKGTLSVNDVTIEQALNLIAKSFGLDWTIYSGAVFISEPGEIEKIKKETAAKALYDKEIALLDQNITLLNQKLEWVRQRYEKGAASVVEVDEAQQKVIGAQLEKIRAEMSRLSGQPSAAVAPSGGYYYIQDFLNAVRGGKISLDEAARGIADAINKGELSRTAAQAYDEAMRSFKAKFDELLRKSMETGKRLSDSDLVKRTLEELGYSDVAIPAAPGGGGGGTEWSGRRDVLYVEGMKNFAGPQALDLDSGKTTPLPAGVPVAQFLKDNPNFALAATAQRFGVLPLAGETNRVAQAFAQEGAGLLVNTSVRVAFLPEVATPQTVPHDLEFAQPLSLPDFQTWVVYSKEHPGMPFLLSGPQSLCNVVIDYRHPFVVDTDGGTYFVKVLERSESSITLGWTTIRSKRPPTAASGKRARSSMAPEVGGTVVDFRLYAPGIPNFVGPQVLDIDSGQTKPLAKGSTPEDFLAANSDFDLAWLGEDSILVANKGTKAVFVPPITTPETVPQDIEYPEPASAREFPKENGHPVFTYSDQEGRRHHKYGIYTDDRGFLYIVPGTGASPFALRTPKGEYVIFARGGGQGEITLSGWKVRDLAAPAPEAPQAKKPAPAGQAESAEKEAADRK